mmetsp:Transcript_90911/g.262027  ORF Transcript_90911/g.262027 Transcript_90911/m.262027 type:complete len:302 (-) Transcript_90911:158-1063(-)
MRSTTSACLFNISSKCCKSSRYRSHSACACACWCSMANWACSALETTSASSSAMRASFASSSVVCRMTESLLSSSAACKPSHCWMRLWMLNSWLAMASWLAASLASKWEICACCCSFRSCWRSNWSVVMSSKPCCFCNISLNRAINAAWESTFSSSSSTSRSTWRNSSFRNSASSSTTPSLTKDPTCALAASSSMYSKMSAQPMSASSTKMERRVCRVKSNFAFNVPTSLMSLSRSTGPTSSPGAPRPQSMGAKSAGGMTIPSTASPVIFGSTLSTSSTNCRRSRVSSEACGEGSSAAAGS